MAADEQFSIGFHMNFHADQKRRIEGPTRTEVANARRRWRELRGKALALYAQGDLDAGWRHDELALDLACEFRPYGYDIDDAPPES